MKGGIRVDNAISAKYSRYMYSNDIFCEANRPILDLLEKVCSVVLIGREIEVLTTFCRRARKTPILFRPRLVELLSLGKSRKFLTSR